MNSSDLVLLEHHHQLVNAIAISEDPKLTRPIRTLLIGIATFFNVEKQYANPSRKSISKRTDNYCPNHITALIKQAKEAGFIKVKSQFKEYQGDSSPRQIANIYEFVLEKFNLYYSKFAVTRKKEKRQEKQKEQDWQKSTEQRVKESDEAVRLAMEEYQSEHPDFDWEAWAADHP